MYRENDVRKLYNFLFSTKLGNAESVTATYSLLTDVLNCGKDNGVADEIFGLYEGHRSTSYTLMIPPQWKGTLTNHICDCAKKYDFTECKENLVITFQGECMQSEPLPYEITCFDKKYLFAGTVLGNTVHAVAIVGTEEVGVFLMVDDSSVDKMRKDPTTR